MWTWTKITITACAVFGAICAIAVQVMWFEMKKQNKQADALHPPPPPRPGFWNIRPGETVTTDHRKNYPESKLRKQMLTFQILYMAAGAVAMLTWFLFPDLP